MKHRWEMAVFNCFTQEVLMGSDFDGDVQCRVVGAVRREVREHVICLRRFAQAQEPHLCSICVHLWLNFLAAANCGDALTSLSSEHGLPSFPL
jgi:hypothetical protein